MRSPQIDGKRITAQTLQPPGGQEVVEIPLSEMRRMSAFGQEGGGGGAVVGAPEQGPPKIVETVSQAVFRARQKV